MKSLKLAACYLLGVPAIYIVLTDKSKDKFVVFHASQALKLWIWFFVIFFAVRLLVNLVWRIAYVPYLDKLEVLAAMFMAGYALYCAKRVLGGEVFYLPH